MENEYQILNTIEKNNTATQRDIAQKTGLSLGSVNVLIKRLVKKGLLKIDRLNPRTLRYILTPKGIQEKARATYRYIMSSYRYISEMEQKIEDFLGNQMERENQSLLLFGQKDEIFDLLLNKLDLMKIDFMHFESYNQVENCDKSNSQPIVVWHTDYADKLSDKGIDYINFLEVI